jgi:RimJ/RimL family protein N-acetyltransferase
LETDRLRIRELTMADLDTIHRILNDAFATDMPLATRERWLQWTVLGYEMFADLEQPHYGERAITLKDTGALIGAIGTVPYIDNFSQLAAFNTPSRRATAEVGLFWAVDPAQQGQGFATEAARALVAYLHRALKLGRIIATTDDRNHASQAVMRKLGMTIEQIEKAEPPGILVVGVLDEQTGGAETPPGDADSFV